MATSGGIWAPIAVRAVRHVFRKTASIVRARIAEASRPFSHELQPVLRRTNPRHAIHPVARIRQAKGKWYTTHSTINAAVRRFISTSGGHATKYDRSTFPKSSTAAAICKLTTRAPFASTLRPNLTGGAFPRTSGGYSLGGGRTGGARYFSHTPASPAQIVNNCSAGVRAFLLSGQKAQFDGISSLGEKRYRNISNLQEETSRNMQTISRNTAGSYVDFHISPTITALTPPAVTFPFDRKVKQSVPSLNTDGFLDVLSVDFARALKDFGIIMNDLNRLASLGDLPVALEAPSVLRVRFPGCDAEKVERLCDELGVQRGIICQDEDFEPAAGTHAPLIFPFAPTTDPTLSSLSGSFCFETREGHEEIIDDIASSPWLEGYSSMDEISEGWVTGFSKPAERQSLSDYEGSEDIYRFIEQCDSARRRR